ncbi:LA_2272 family surface repeat-containing protein [uncultured Winogradskyella sp.]|uniref:LA_2272 family surface repeat-containing protein n=1 Tax=uncultured Winogradskyella sp. TaxID=395353 RepID=UPI0026120CDD|nr:hypothetical protein [uncultured Winogradskyella sp.]
MKKFFLITGFILIPLTCLSQINLEQKIKIKDSIEVRSVFSFSPSRAKKINGLSLKYWYSEDKTYKVNGLELGLNPLSIFFPFLTAIHSIPPFLHNPPLDDLSKLDSYKFDKINGIRFGIAFLDPAIINGLELNLTGGFDTQINGVSITPLVNKHFKVNGLSVALLGNFDTQVKGIQIGLFNKCNNLKGIQIGLWNKNEKRSLPFINWNFKS